MTFSGTTQTDFMKLGAIPDRKKNQYIDYAGTDFYSIRENIIEYIQSVYPLDYQNFSESDLGMMLIEMVSYMGSVLSLKGDMLANENYIRTVKNRNNLQKLLELVGVSMRGPLGAAAGAVLETTATMATANFPLRINAADRVFSIIGKEDGAPVNYTLCKVENNKIQDIQNANASFDLEQSETLNGGVGGASSIFTNVGMLEGALTIQEGVFDTLEGNKLIVLSDNPIIDGSVQVFITTPKATDAAQGAYSQVDRLYSASGPTDKIFQVVYDDNYGATVIFGDNVLGISPPAGAQFTVAYRVGGGSRGNIGQEMINVTIPAYKASTYTDSISFITENRVVTLEDYVAFGNTFRTTQGTVGKTTAVLRDAYSSANVIDIYTLEKADDLRLQRASTTFKEQLLAEIEPKKMMTDEVVVVDGLIRTLDIVITARIDRELEPQQSRIQQQISNVILNHFNIDNSDFGRPFVAAELNRDIFTLPDIRYSTVDNLPEKITVDFNEIIQLNNFTINIVLV